MPATNYICYIHVLNVANEESYCFTGGTWEVLGGTASAQLVLFLSHKNDPTLSLFRLPSHSLVSLHIATLYTSYTLTMSSGMINEQVCTTHTTINSIEL